MPPFLHAGWSLSAQATPCQEAVHETAESMRLTVVVVATHQAAGQARNSCHWFGLVAGAEAKTVSRCLQRRRS